MVLEDYAPIIIQTLFSFGGFVYILGRYKQILENNGKILEKQEQAILSILNKLDNMNSELNFIKGAFYGKKKD